MHLITIAAGLIGVALVLVVWLSVLRTVFTPRMRTSRAARRVLRVVAPCVLAVARRVPCYRRERVLDMCAPITLFGIAGVWVGASLFGFSLIGWSLDGLASGEVTLADFHVNRAQEGPLAGLVWVSEALLLAAITTYILRFTDAYGRRERVVARLAGRVVQPQDADALLVTYLRTGSRDHLDTMFGQWTDWMTDVESTHVAYPALTFSRPAGDLCWLRAAVTVLDIAAVTEAVAPNWAPPCTRALLTTGSRCMQRLAAEFALVLPRAVVSLQGREERSFSDTLRAAQNVGLPAQREEEEAWLVFQSLRTRYAPHAHAMETHLLYEDVDVEDDEDDEDVDPGPVPAPAEDGEIRGRVPHKDEARR
ncbi:hypothetical protein Ssi03_57510 [Sphaerisporangium siamense]|uniref:Uncharacterized protein n=1 Tax=Sphaerisporangium siamense TaxID=795645 RepID=A0A7W7G980_9ACTN|nr:hypothetical protein [Sphaerisporangium siamense]MBB4700345.1 hypothetical protein [Sphaerisporangium siamense]GII87761.1 hypothetical protein Ssi03_57510 [Sphaerisporangium siamense]